MHVSLLPCFLSQERPEHEKFVLFGSFRCILMQIIVFFILLFAVLQVKLTNFQTQLVECKQKSAKSENTGNPKTAPRGTNGPSLPTNFAHAALLPTPASANSDTPFFLANSDTFSPANSDTTCFLSNADTTFLCKGGIRVILNLMGNLGSHFFGLENPTFWPKGHFYS